MKLSTRFFGVLTLLLIQLSALAATVTVEAGSSFAAAAAAQITPQLPPEAKAAPVGLSVYPNPSKGQVTVTLAPTAAGVADYKLRLSNIIGREVRTVLLRSEMGSSGITLNFSDLPAGMYLCSLLQADKVVATKRLVLQN